MERSAVLNIGGLSFPLPCYLPSISSVKTHLPPIEYLRVLSAMKYPAFLISAYDIHHSNTDDRIEIDRLLQQSIVAERFILLDSGNYEAYWKGDKTWSKDILDSILKTKTFHLAFHFDNQYPSQLVADITKDIENEVIREQAVSQGATVIPIVHATTDILPEVVLQVARKLQPILVAVPERMLGDGLFQRAATVKKIRESLSQVGYYCPLHLLGTGNPLSIALYSACGADCFDGLEWCQTSVDHASGRLFHFQQYDLFRHQTPIGKLDSIPYSQLVLSHNLIFYKKWMDAVRESLINNRISELIAKHLPPEAVDSLNKLKI